MKAVKAIFASSFALVLCSNGFAQKSSHSLGSDFEMPTMEMPAISSPSMPRVTAPSMGSSFYAPKIEDFYSGAIIKHSENAAAKPKKTESENGEQNKTQDKTADLTKILGGALRGSSILSANDLSSLDASGNFTNLSSLLGTSPALSTLNSNTRNILNSSSQYSSNEILLNKILTELVDLKKQVNQQKEAKNVSFANGNNLSQPKKEESNSKEENLYREEKKARILRFFVNGYNVLPTCKTVYFSDEESNGSFLLTGDRLYTTNGQSRTETFYILFKAEGSSSGVISYAVTPAVSQDFENQYSFLYQLSKKKDLKAERTGNLISMRVNEKAWNFDLLIDAGKVK